MNNELLAKFEQSYEAEPMSGCWLWTKALTKCGYANFYFDGKFSYGHRASYELFKGAIPKGMMIDHLCRMKCCVNPHHLEAVSNAENVARGYFAKNGFNSSKCKPFNLRISSELKDELANEAKELKRSFNQHLTLILAEYVQMNQPIVQ